MNPILRGVAIAGEVRALARPASAKSMPAAVPIAARAALPAAGDALEQRQQAFDAGYEEGRRQGLVEGYRDAQARGHEEGFAAGQEQARRNAQEELERLQAATAQSERERAQRIEALLDAMQDALRDHFAAAEEDMLALCFEAVGAVFGELATRGEGIRALVQNALAQSRQLGPTTVHLHPRDLALVESDLAAWSAARPARKLQFVPDESISLGGCVLASTHGGLDARIETQLARVADVFRRVRDEERHA